MMTKNLNLYEIIDNLRLKVLAIARNISDLQNIYVENYCVGQPILFLLNIVDKIDSGQIQVINPIEYKLIQNTTTEEARLTSIERLLEKKVIAVILTDNFQLTDYELEIFKKYDVPLLSTEQNYEDFVYFLSVYLRKHLDIRLSKHGVLLEVYGEGLLLLGRSGVGKTETAIELVRRGHFLVADDCVNIRKVSLTTLIGSCPEKIRGLVEVRGVGIIDFIQIFGIKSIKKYTNIDIIVHLERADSKFNRIELKTEYEEILGIDVPSLKIPVKVERNLAIILETAALNNKLKKQGGTEYWKKIRT